MPGVADVWPVANPLPQTGLIVTPGDFRPSLRDGAVAGWFTALMRNVMPCRATRRQRCRGGCRPGLHPWAAGHTDPHSSLETAALISLLRLCEVAPVWPPPRVSLRAHAGCSRGPWRVG
jgi:hypothetical protein